MKFDAAAMKEINKAIDMSLKKNKELKAASNVEKSIDDYMKKNKDAIANARLIAALEKRVKELETKLQTIDKMQVRIMGDQSDYRIDALKWQERVRKLEDKIDKMR